MSGIRSCLWKGETLLRIEFDVLENGEETYEPCLRVEEDGIEGPAEYRRPV